MLIAFLTPLARYSALPLYLAPVAAASSTLAVPSAFCPAPAAFVMFCMLVSAVAPPLMELMMKFGNCLAPSATASPSAVPATLAAAFAAVSLQPASTRSFITLC